jgi:hypothetical protein
MDALKNRLSNSLTSVSANGGLCWLGVVGMATTTAFAFIKLWSILIALSRAYTKDLTVGAYDEIARSSAVCGGVEL